MMKKNIFSELEERIIFIPLLISFVLTIAGLLFKVLGNEELASQVTTGSYYAYAWVCCLCLGICARDHRYLRLNIAAEMYPASLRKFLEIANGLLGFVISVALLIGSFLVIQNYLGGESVDKMVLFTYFAPVAGLLFGVVRMIQKVLHHDKNKGEEER